MAKVERGVAYKYVFGEDRSSLHYLLPATETESGDVVSVNCPRAYRCEPWQECDVIEEEGLLEDAEDPQRDHSLLLLLDLCPRLHRPLHFLLSHPVGRRQIVEPKIVTKSIMFENFDIQPGTDDASLVPTDMATLNSAQLILVAVFCSFVRRSELDQCAGGNKHHSSSGSSESKLHCESQSLCVRATGEAKVLC